MQKAVFHTKIELVCKQYRIRQENIIPKKATDNGVEFLCYRLTFAVITKSVIATEQVIIKHTHATGEDRCVCKYTIESNSYSQILT